MTEVREDQCRSADLLRLLRSSDAGEHWVAVTPPGMTCCVAGVQSMLDGRAWLVTDDCAVQHPQLWRTADFGRTWTQLSMPVSHSCNAGAAAGVQFLHGGRIGFATQEEPTGPGVTVFRSVDGGRRWRMWTEPPFVGGTSWADSAHGLNVEQSFFGAGVAMTSDGGHRWQTITPAPAQRNIRYSLPVFLSPTRGVLLATTVNGRLGETRAYTSFDRGRSWQFVGNVPCAAPVRPDETLSPAQLVAVSRSAWWVVTGDGWLCRTVSAGRSWSRTRLPRGTSGLSASDGLEAVVSSSAGQPTALFRTEDGGRSWVRLTRLTAGCRSADLTARFGGVGFATGNAFTRVSVRNTSALPCWLSGTVTLVPYDGDGRRIRTPRPLTATVSPRLTLIGEHAAVVVLGGTERDDPSQPNGLCRPADQVTPARWVVQLADGTLSVPYGDPYGGNLGTFAGCHADFFVVEVHAEP